jgi:hypothetical protein
MAANWPFCVRPRPTKKDGRGKEGGWTEETKEGRKEAYLEDGRKDGRTK